jgi:hypothetical protein
LAHDLDDEHTHLDVHLHRRERRGRADQSRERGTGNERLDVAALEVHRGDRAEALGSAYGDGTPDAEDDLGDIGFIQVP